MTESKRFGLEKKSLSSISICMTAYNEQELIEETINDCTKLISTIPGEHEILVVNDGSTDDTGKILNKLSIKDSSLQILEHPKNLGIARAQRWLIQEAKGDLIFHFPADGEFKAQDLNKLLVKLEDGYDIVIGVRLKKQYSFYRSIISWIYNKFVLILFRTNLVDIGSIRLARASLWKRIPAESNSAFFIAEKLLIAHLNGARIGFTSVDHIWRSKGRSKFNNPVMALFTLSELFNFWLTYRSRPKIDLYKEYANHQ